MEGQGAVWSRVTWLSPSVGEVGVLERRVCQASSDPDIARVCSASLSLTSSEKPRAKRLFGQGSPRHTFPLVEFTFNIGGNEGSIIPGLRFLVFQGTFTSC